MTHAMNEPLEDSTVVPALSRHVADAAVLYQRLRAFHWMIRGNAFFQLHAFFEEQYDFWAQATDDLAERMLALGGRPPLTLREILATASLGERSPRAAAGEMIRQYRDDLRHLRDALAATITAAEAEGDRATVNLLDGLRDNAEKTLWMLGAFLSGD
ncbi:MAG: DNA starvation/stationary phase protection protein [Acidobacteriota bacterium]|nr:DNA starvation/stationary phase protection protein [Acidobacteriota bacterium]MDQ7088343.1 DNA starvation/stationary phase protection protein [Acidobacteriota bacterium]